MLSPLLRPKVTSILFAILITIQLAACSTEENIAGAGDNSSAVGIAALSWVAPSEREDNTPISLAEIAGYRIYYGTAQGVYQNQIEVDDTYSTEISINLVSGTYYAVITTMDVDGRESQFSSEVTITI